MCRKTSWCKALFKMQNLKNWLRSVYPLVQNYLYTKFKNYKTLLIFAYIHTHKHCLLDRYLYCFFFYVLNEEFLITIIFNSFIIKGKYFYII